MENSRYDELEHDNGEVPLEEDEEELTPEQERQQRVGERSKFVKRALKRPEKLPWCHESNPYIWTPI